MEQIRVQPKAVDMQIWDAFPCSISLRVCCAESLMIKMETEGFQKSKWSECKKGQMWHTRRWMKRRTWENPRPGRKRSSQHSVGIHCTAVSSPPPHPTHRGAAVLQSVRGERGGGEEGEEEEEERRGGHRTVVTSPSGGRQEERRIIAAANGATTLFTPTREKEREGERERREVQKSTESSWPDFSFLHPTF